MPEHHLKVNGRELSVITDRERTLLDVLREDFGLTGTKYGCGEGECGACTVLVDGRAVRSCMTAVDDIGGKSVQTIEGLASEERLHPVQQAFVDEQAMQCGYCVPGQILTAVDLLSRTPQPTRQEIIAGMNGNVCRCCNYHRILAAVERAAKMTNGTHADGGQS